MQPRHDFDQERLSELADSFKQNGIIQPLVVKVSGPNYVIIAGERRYRAARLAGFGEVPALVMDDVDDARTLELALVENIQREDLNPIELAEAYRRLMQQCGLTQNELAERVGKSRAALANQLRLLALPESIQLLVRQLKLTEGHARAILALESESAMKEMAETIMSGQLTVRDVERAVAPKRKRRKLQVRRKQPIVLEIEAELKQRLGTSVRITPGLKHGRIEIEYYGDDDLGRLVELFRKIG
jgi:ParB family chromosome partitioning protein